MYILQNFLELIGNDKIALLDFCLEKQYSELFNAISEDYTKEDLNDFINNYRHDCFFLDNNKERLKNTVKFMLENNNRIIDHIMKYHDESEVNDIIMIFVELERFDKLSEYYNSSRGFKIKFCLDFLRNIENKFLLKYILKNMTIILKRDSGCLLYTSCINLPFCVFKKMFKYFPEMDINYKSNSYYDFYEYQDSEEEENPSDDEEEEDFCLLNLFEKSFEDEFVKDREEKLDFIVNYPSFNLYGYNLEEFPDNVVEKIRKRRRKQMIGLFKGVHCLLKLQTDIYKPGCKGFKRVENHFKETIENKEE